MEDLAPLPGSEQAPTILGMDELEDILGPLLYTPVSAHEASAVVVPATSYELQKVSHTHHAIMDYLIANPTQPMSAVAAAFNYTPAWLSTLVHSDVFQRELGTRRANWRNVHDTRLSGRLLGLAETALGRMQDALEEDDANGRPVSAATANEIAKTALSALGFIGGKGAQQAAVVVTNNIQVNADDLRLAQQIMLGASNA